MSIRFCKGSIFEQVLKVITFEYEVAFSCITFTCLWIKRAKTASKEIPKTL